MNIKLVQLGEDGLACEGGVCAIPEKLVETEKTGSARPQNKSLADTVLAGRDVPARHNDDAKPE